MNLEYERPLRLIHLGHFQLNFAKLLTKGRAIRIHQKILEAIARECIQSKPQYLSRIVQ